MSYKKINRAQNNIRTVAGNIEEIAGFWLYDFELNCRLQSNS